MKHLLSFLMLISVCITSYGQDKYSSTYFNKLTEVDGTAFVIATVETWGKIFKLENRYLLFINTENGETHQVDFPNKGSLGKIEQVKIDELGINRIIVPAQTVDLDGKKGIDWNDPLQLIVLSTDGKERVQLTDDKFFVRAWVVNKKTGTIVVTGNYDKNGNGKIDKGDTNEVSIYDLKTLKQVRKM